MSFAARIKASRDAVDARNNALRVENTSKRTDITRPEYTAAYDRVLERCVKKHAEIEKAALEDTCPTLYEGNDLDVWYALDTEMRFKLLQRLKNAISEVYEGVLDVHHMDNEYGCNGDDSIRIYACFKD